MASSASSSSFGVGRNDFSPRSTPQSSRTSMARASKSNLRDFGTPIKVESSSPYRTTPASSSKASAFLAKTPFGTPNRSITNSNNLTTANFQSSVAPSQPPKPLSGRAQLTARVRSLWLSGDTATSILQAKGYLPYSGLAKLMLQTSIDRLYFFSILAIHLFLSLSLFSPLRPLTSIFLPLRPSILLLTLMAFSLSIIPLIVLRKTEITKPKLPAKDKVDAAQDVTIAGVILPYGSPSAHYYSVLSQARTGLLIGLYALSGLFLAASHAAGLMLYSSDANAWLPYQSVSFRNTSGLRVSSLRPNERLFFLLGSNLLIGVLYILHRSLSLSPSLCDTSSSQSAIVFEPQATVESLGVRLSSKIRRRLPRALVTGLVSPIALLVVYLFLRRPLFRLVLSVIGHNSSLRPILIPSFRHRFLSIELVFRTAILGSFSTVTWETFNILWEVLSTQPYTHLQGGLSQFAREPTKCLIEGMQSGRIASATEANLGAQERQYYAHFAFAEMAVVVATDFERRKAIFRQVGSSNANVVEAGSKSAWVLIAQECMKVLQEERLCLTTRGKQVVPATSTTTTPATVSQLKATESSHKVLVESGTSALKKRPVSIWDRLASSGPPSSIESSAAKPASGSNAQSSTETATSSSNDLGSIMHRLASSIPSLQSQLVKTSTAKGNSATQSSSSTKGATSTTSTISSVLLNIVVNVFKTVYILLPPDFRHVVSRLPFVRSFISINKTFLTSTSQTLLYTGKLPRDTALTTWSIQILSALLSASVDQDEYGTIALSSHQKLGVDDVLEEMANLLLTLSQWGQEIAQEMQGDSEASKRELTMLWDRRVAPIVVASRTAINLILGVFEPTGFQLRQSAREKIDKALTAA